MRSDARGNIIEALQRNPSEVAEIYSRIVLTYDSSDHLIEKVMYVSDVPMTETRYSYNEHGDIATERNGENLPAVFTYEYDGHGNWTRQMVQHAQGSYEARRRIQYFD